MTTEITIKLQPIVKTDTTCNIFNATELVEVLDFTKVNGFDKCLLLQHVEYGEANFERKSDWMRFVNKLDRHNTIPIKRILTGNKKSSDWGGMIVKRETIEYYEDGVLIEFERAAGIIVETVGDNYIIVEAKKIRGQITWEWLSRRTGHEDLGHVAGICEIWMHSIEILA